MNIPYSPSADSNASSSDALSPPPDISVQATPTRPQLNLNGGSHGQAQRRRSASTGREDTLSDLRRTLSPASTRPSTSSSVHQPLAAAVATITATPTIYIYPAAVPEISSLPDEIQELKLARFLPCRTADCSCAGLRPPPSAQIRLQNGTSQANGKGKSVQEEPVLWDLCGGCGHEWRGDDVVDGGHTLGEEVEEVEVQRRRRVAGRIEELLQDKGKLLDFDYRDKDITGLSRQIGSFSAASKHTGKSLLRPDSPSSNVSTPLASVIPLDDSNPSQNRKRKRPGSRTPSVAIREEGEVDDEEDGGVTEGKNGGPKSDADESSEEDQPLSKVAKLNGSTSISNGAPPAGRAIAGKGIRSVAGAGKVPGKGKQREPVSVVRKFGEDVVVDEEGHALHPAGPSIGHAEDAMEVDEGVEIGQKANKGKGKGKAEEDEDEGVDLGKGDAMAPDAGQVEAAADLVNRLTQGVAVDIEQAIDNAGIGEDVNLGELEDWDDLDVEPIPAKPAAIEFEQDIIRLPVVSSSCPSPVASIVLIGLKNLFQKQLPKMPREYITRLVLDRNHYSMAIVRKGWRVVGGICYRPFESRNFAEIVFCAVDSSEQIRGYGSFMMTAIKDYIRKAHPTIDHFLTYADNYAIGYFKKLGFSKEITFPRERWVGYIKDYDQANLMMCKMAPSIKYLEVHQVLHYQKAAILAKIKTISQSHVVRPGLQAFKDRKPGQEIKLAKEEIPGLVESGWDPEMDEILRQPKRSRYHVLLRQILDDMQNDTNAWPFDKPVNPELVQNYYDTVKEPMDLLTMEKKLENNLYSDLEEFKRDAKLIFTNCRMFNGHDERSNTYTKAANALEKALDKSIARRLKALGEGAQA